MLILTKSPVNLWYACVNLFFGGSSVICHRVARVLGASKRMADSAPAVGDQQAGAEGTSTGRMNDVLLFSGGMWRDVASRPSYSAAVCYMSLPCTQAVLDIIGFYHDSARAAHDAVWDKFNGTHGTSKKPHPKSAQPDAGMGVSAAQASFFQSLHDQPPPPKPVRHAPLPINVDPTLWLVRCTPVTPAQTA